MSQVGKNIVSRFVKLIFFYHHGLEIIINRVLKTLWQLIHDKRPWIFYRKSQFCNVYQWWWFSIIVDTMGSNWEIFKSMIHSYWYHVTLYIFYILLLYCSEINNLKVVQFHTLF